MWVLFDSGHREILRGSFEECYAAHADGTAIVRAGSLYARIYGEG